MTVGSDMSIANQVRTFNISTPDGESLYAWHVLPLGVYMKNEAALLAEPHAPGVSFMATKGFELLSGPDSLLIVSCVFPSRTCLIAAS